MNKLIPGLRASARLMGLGLFTTIWILFVGCLLFFSKDKLSTSLRWRTFWINTMLPFLGVRLGVTFTEELPDYALYIGNHRSYLDPIIALKYLRAVVIAKAEVAKWPVIGTAAKLAATVFVRRGDRDSRQEVLNAMRSILLGHGSVLVFPEGTTSRSPQLLDFKPGAFQLAAQLNTPVVPFALEYLDPDDAWIGDDTFIPHFIRVFGRRKTHVRMHFGPVLKQTDPQELMKISRWWIADTLPTLQE